MSVAKQPYSTSLRILTGSHLKRGWYRHESPMDVQQKVPMNTHTQEVGRLKVLCPKIGASQSGGRNNLCLVFKGKPKRNQLEAKSNQRGAFFLLDPTIWLLVLLLVSLQNQTDKMSQHKQNPGFLSISLYHQTRGTVPLEKTSHPKNDTWVWVKIKPPKNRTAG